VISLPLSRASRRRCPTDCEGRSGVAGRRHKSRGFRVGCVCATRNVRVRYDVGEQLVAVLDGSRTNFAPAERRWLVEKAHEAGKGISATRHTRRVAPCK
jgi:hypothetical protein